MHETQQEHDDRKHPMHTGNRSDEPVVLAARVAEAQALMTTVDERPQLPDPATAMQVIDPTYGFPDSHPTGELCRQCGLSESECTEAFVCCLRCTHEED